MKYDLTGAEELFVGRIQALVGATIFDRDFFVKNVDCADIKELVDHLVDVAGIQYPLSAATLRAGLIQHWVALFKIVQDNCSAIHGWPIIKNFQIYEYHNNIRIDLQLIQAVGDKSGVIIGWILHSLLPDNQS